MSCDKCQQPVPDEARSVSRLGRQLPSLAASRQEKTSRWLLSGRSTRSPNKRPDSWKPAGGEEVAMAVVVVAGGGICSEISATRGIGSPDKLTVRL